jgi:hypothetical protein
MAFHQPTHPPPKAPVTSAPRPRPSTLSVQRDAGIDDSQEWVLFSPSQYQASPTLSTELTSRTAGLSRLSDFGSLNTIGRTEPDDQELSDVAEDEDELDSLDDGLHAFREPASTQSGFARRLDQSGGTILPAHDGLGMFPSSNAQVQEQLWNHERYNPRRRAHGHYRTLSSVQRRLEALNEEASPDTGMLDDGRLERIQKWRFEQSEILLDELSQSASLPQSPHRAASVDGAQRVRAGIAAHKEAVASGTSDETLWERLTRTVIRNLVGIDDGLLAVILGDSVVEEGRRGLETVTEDPAQPAPTSSPREVAPATSEWEARLIRRIARELENFVQHWSTASRALPAPLDPIHMDYAGMHVRPERRIEEAEKPSKQQLAAEQSAAFHPTLQAHHPGEALYHEDDRNSAMAELDYWEQTPGLRSVFSYLARRFLSRGRTHTTSTPIANDMNSTPNLVATSPSPASLHRAAIIQQHHPLVARSRAAHVRRRRNSLRLSQVGLRTTLPGSLKRAGTSCASWSTKRSRIEASEGSRNYWDLGGSLGSESLVLGGVGHWGEV